MAAAAGAVKHYGPIYAQDFKWSVAKNLKVSDIALYALGRVVIFFRVLINFKMDAFSEKNRFDFLQKHITEGKTADHNKIKLAILSISGSKLAELFDRTGGSIQTTALYEAVQNYYDKGETSREYWLDMVRALSDRVPETAFSTKIWGKTPLDMAQTKHTDVVQEAQKEDSSDEVNESKLHDRKLMDLLNAKTPSKA